MKLAAVSLICCSSACAQVRIALESVGRQTDFPNASFVSQAPGESRRLHIARLTGVIGVFKDGAASATPFLTVPVVSGGESGLLGMAFHPAFQSNGYVYICYTGPFAGTSSGTHIVRYTTDPSNPDVADPASAFHVLLINRSPSTNHQGGWIGFGPDGYLYIASGNGGIATNSSLLTTLLGKMLRIDVDHDDFPADPVKNYAIPPTNPLFGSTTNLPEIWAYGLRNPWRNSIDRVTGDLWIGDVNDGQAGEIDFQPAGVTVLRHYGYPCMEGLTCRAAVPNCTCNDPSLTLPVLPLEAGIATVGGYRYRGQAIPALWGAYVYGDYGGTLASFRFDGGVVSDLTTYFGSGSLISSLGEDNAGELYICRLSSGVFKVVPFCAANCDNSLAPPRLNALDFHCFINRFAAGDSYANCDNSTTLPTLNALDFGCFLQQFAAGCP